MRFICMIYFGQHGPADQSLSPHRNIPVYLFALGSVSGLFLLVFPLIHDELVRGLIISLCNCCYWLHSSIFKFFILLNWKLVILCYLQCLVI